MDENTNKALFTLMQKVVDKLETISKDVNRKDQTKLEDIIKDTNIQTDKLVLQLVEALSKLLKNSLDTKNEIVEYVEKSIETPNVNNYTEYSLFGSKSHFKPWIIGVFFFGLVTVWCSIKYLPSYFTEKSLLSKERAEYQIFYNYVYLKQIRKDEPIIANDILKRIKQKDTLFMKEYHTLLKTHQREIKKQELKEQLNALDNNDS